MKIFNIIFFLTVIILFNPNAFGQTELDCSQYNTKTWSGLMDKMRYKKGLPPKEKREIKKFGDLMELLLKPKLMVSTVLLVMVTIFLLSI